MKKIFFILAFIVSTLAVSAQNEIPVFSIQTDGTITPNQSMITPFYQEPKIETLTYSPKNPVIVTIGAKTYTIKTSCFINWDDEDSGFNVISIYSGNQRIFELKQPQCWTFIYGGPSMTNYTNYTNNRYFIPVKLSSIATALIFIGWPYGGEMPYLTIIVLSGNSAKLVFNKNVGINSISKSDTSFSMITQSNIVEYNANGTPYTSPITHQIYLKNGVLYYK